MELYYRLKLNAELCEKLNISIYSLVIPQSVTSIGNYAFNGCAGLNGKLTIGGNSDGITVGNGAFYGCNKLTSVELKNGITSIGDSAFYNCSGLTGDLIIPDSVTSIGTSAFRGCSGLNGELKLSENLTAIPSYAFSGCSGINGELVIPDNVKTIDYNAFSYPSSNTSYAGSQMSKVTSIVFGEGVKQIGTSGWNTYNDPFYGFTGVKEVTFKSTDVPTRYVPRQLQGR